MSGYQPCPGTGERGQQPHKVDVTGLGSKFNHMRGKTYGTCPTCGRTGLALLPGGNHTASFIPRHKEAPKP